MGKSLCTMGIVDCTQNFFLTRRCTLDQSIPQNGIINTTPKHSPESLSSDIKCTSESTAAHPPLLSRKENHLNTLTDVNYYSPHHWPKRSLATDPSKRARVVVKPSRRNRPVTKRLALPIAP